MSSNTSSDDFTVFISYAHSDNESPDPSRRWLNRLLEYLQPLVFQKQVRIWSDIAIESGEQWHESIKTQLQNAKVAVLLVSPAFLASEYIRNSELPVLLMKAQKSGVTVLPIILRRCLFTTTKFKYPDPLSGPDELSLSTFQSANSPNKPLNAMQEHEQDEVLVSVAEQISNLAQQSHTRPPSEGAATASGKGMSKVVAAIWNIPHPRNPFFTGRSEVLDHLHRELIATGKAALSLSGMGGVGKTQTAIEYAYRHRGEYGAVLWAKAESEDSLKADLTAIAAVLDLPEKNETDRDKVVSAVKRWLEEHTGWLLILDNADDLRLVSDLLRREWGGHLLLTSRAHGSGRVNQVELTMMTPEEGTVFLLRRAKLIALDDALTTATESDRELAAKITREAGGLPLALDQAGAFIEEKPSSLAEYLELYQKEGAKLRAERGGVTPDHDPVTITFSLAFQQVEGASAAAADMLRVCAFLAPDAIPEEIFTIGAAELGENLAPAAGGGVNLVEIFGEAGRFSLIRRNTKSGTIEIHRLVQQVLRDEMDDETRRLWAERVVRAVNEVFPVVDHNNWSLCEKLLPHAVEAAKHIEKYNFKFREAWRLLNQAGYYCCERAQFAEAEPLFALGLKITNPDHPDAAWSLGNLAKLYISQGKYTEAEPLSAQALDIMEKSFGSNDQYVAVALNNLASIYDVQGRYVEAEPLYVRAMGILEKARGSEHPDVASVGANLAHFYTKLGKYAEAEQLLARVLGILEKAFGPDHPDLATGLSHLAILYEKQGDYAEAEQLLARALGILEKTIGPDHPDVAICRSNLASIYEARGRYAEAEELYAQALDTLEKALGPDHPTLAMSLNNLASLYNKQGRYPEAELFLVRALGLIEKVMGQDHPNAAMAATNLAYIYSLQGRYSEAEPLFVRAISIYENVFEADHPTLSLVRMAYNELKTKMRFQTEG